VLALVFVAFEVVRPFVAVALWAAVLAVALHAAQLRLTAALGGRPTAAAVILTVLGLVVVFGPVSLIVLEIVSNLRAGLAWVQSGEPIVGPPPDAVRDLPLVGDAIQRYWSQAHQDIAGTLRQAEPQLERTGLVALHGALVVGREILELAAAVIVAGFLLRYAGPAERRVAAMAEAIGGARALALLGKVGLTIRQVSRGVVGVAAFQALAATIALIAAGVPAAGLLGILVFVLSVVQFGAPFVLILAGLWAYAEQGALAVVAIGVGLVVLLLSEHLLKPFVLAHGLATPLWVILIGVVGGTIGFGLIGVFVGPVVLAVIYDLLLAALGPADERAAPPPD
jgi:predicted PurR-regulated permease PerM